MVLQAAFSKLPAVAASTPVVALSTPVVALSKLPKLPAVAVEAAVSELSLSGPQQIMLLMLQASFTV